MRLRFKVSHQWNYDFTCLYKSAYAYLQFCVLFIWCLNHDPDSRSRTHQNCLSRFWVGKCAYRWRRFHISWRGVWLILSFGKETTEVFCHNAFAKWADPRAPLVASQSFCVLDYIFWSSRMPSFAFREALKCYSIAVYSVSYGLETLVGESAKSEKLFEEDR